MKRGLRGPNSAPLTATVQKLARIYNESVFRGCEERVLKRAEVGLRKQAALLGFQIVPAENG